MRAWLLLSLIACSLNAQSIPENMRPARRALWQEVQALNDSMVAAFAADPSSIARFYHDSATIAGGGPQIVSGRQAVDRYWGSLGTARGWRLEVLDVGGNRDLAYQVGRSHLTMSSGQTYTTDFVAVWKRTPQGVLRMLYDLYN